MKQLIMHRALGGAPVSRAQWRLIPRYYLLGITPAKQVLLGRSLLANVNACAAWPCVWQSKAKKTVPAASVLASTLLTP